MKDPENLLERLGLELPGVVDPDVTPVLDARYRTVVNGQFYWVSGRAELELFRAAPYEYTGPLRDPVVGEWFTPTSSSPRRNVRDQIFYFVGDQSAEEFDREPDIHPR